jgi:hypothetical protein
MSPHASKVSVVIVSYNTVADLRRCLAAIGPDPEVIVVDNASSDGSAAMVAAEFPHVRLIANDDNRGFGAANNQGMAVARRPLVLFLNSDCIPAPDAISILAETFEDPTVVAAGAMLLNPDGTLQESVAGPLTLGAVAAEQLRLGGLHYWRTKATLDRSGGNPITVDQVMGACMMIRPVETFDERIFLYAEDTELCERLKKHGRIVYVPSANVTHILGASSQGSHRWWAVAMYNRGKEQYFAIHHGPGALVVCWLLNRLGAFGRFVVWGLATLVTLGLRPRFRSQAALFWRVMTAPLRGPRRPARTRG